MVLAFGTDFDLDFLRFLSLPGASLFATWVGLLSRKLRLTGSGGGAGVGGCETMEGTGLAAEDNGLKVDVEDTKEAGLGAGT